MAVHKVTYKGLSDIRIMTKKELADQQGIGMEGDLVWDKTKHGPVPFIFIEDASDELLSLFRSEGTFTVQEVDESGAPQGTPVVKGAPLDDTGSTVVDKTKGTTSTRSSGRTGAGSSTGTGTSGGTTSTGKGSSTDSPL